MLGLVTLPPIGVRIIMSIYVYRVGQKKVYIFQCTVCGTIPDKMTHFH